MRRWIKWLENRSQVQLSVLGALLVAAFALVELHGPERLAYTPIFLLLIGAVAWLGGAAPAVITAAAAAGYMGKDVWEATQGQPISWIAWVNFALRVGSCLGVGWVVAAWRRVHLELEERVALRTADLQRLVGQHERTEAELRVSREQLAELAENIHEVFWVTDVQKSRMLYISSGYEQIWGRSRESLYQTPLSWLDAVHPADCERVRASTLSDQALGNYDEQYRILRPDGAVRWIRDRAFPIRDAQGQTVRLVGLAEDITEQRQTREKLQTQARVLEHMSEGVVLVGRDFRIRYTNPAFDAMLGRAPGELVGQPMASLSGLPPEATRSRMQEIAAQVQANGHWTGELRHWLKPGFDLVTAAYISRLALNGEEHFVLVFQDITQQQEAQQTLRLQAQVLESMSEVVVLTDQDDRIVLINDAATRMFGYAPGALIGQHASVVMTLEGSVFEQLTEVILEELACSGLWTGDLPIRSEDGEIRLCAARTTRLVLGEKTFYTTVLQDVTAARRAQAALRLHALVLHNMAESVVLTGPDGTIRLANPAMEATFGYAPGELLGQHLSVLNAWPEAETARFNREVARTAEERGVWSGEYLNRRKDGARFTSEARVSTLELDGHLHFVSVQQDITERRRMEQNLRESAEKHRVLFESSPDAYVLLAEGVFVECNHAAEVMLRGDRSRIIGQSPHTLSPEHQPDGSASASAAAARIAEAQRRGAISFEWVHRRLDGSDFWAEVTLSPMTMQERPVFFAAWRDITARKQVEAEIHQLNTSLERRVRERTAELQAANTALRESELKNTALLNATDQPMLLMDLSGTILAANSAMGQRLGRRPEELVGVELVGLMPPDLARSRRAQAEEVVRTGQAVRFEDNRAGMQMDNFIYPVLNEQGGVTALTIFSLDITEHKRMEQALRKSETKYRQLHESMTDAFAAVRMDGRIQDSNRAFREMLGYSAEELGALTYMDLTPQSWHAMETAIVAEQILPRGHSDVYQKEYRRKDGTVLPVELRAFLLRDEAGQPSGIWAIVRDITERQRAEAALRDSEARYRQMIEAVPMLAFRCDAAGLCLDCNQRWYDITGQKPADVVGLGWLAALHPEDRARTVQQARGAVAGQEYYETEYRIRRVSDGAYRWHQARALPLRNAAGEITHWFGYATDIENQKQAEAVLRHSQAGLEVRVQERTAELERANQALRHSEALFRAVTDCCPDPIFLKDRQNRMLFANPALLAVIGKPVEAVIGKTDVEHFPDPAIGRAIIETDQRLMAADAAAVVEETVPGPEGGRTFLSSKAPHHDAAGQVIGLVGVTRDITKRKQAEESLRRSEATLRGILNATQESVWLFSPDGIVLVANPTGAARFGLRAEEFMGRHFSEFLPAELARSRSVHLKAAIESARPVHFEDARNGIRFETDFYPVLDAAGRVTAIASFSQDVTARKEAEELLEAQRELAVTLSRLDALQPALESLLAVITRLPGLDSGGIYLVDPRTGALDLATHHGLSAEFVHRVAHYPADSAQAAVGRSEFPLYSAVADLPPAIGTHCVAEGLQLLAAIPLRDEGRVSAVLNVASHTRAQLPVPIRLALENIAAQAEGVIARLRAEAAQRESDRRLRSIIQGAPIALFAADRNGTLTFLDGRQLRAWATAPHAGVGRPLAESDLVRQFPVLLEHGGRALAGEEFTELAPLDAGFFECSYSPYQDAAGAIAGFIGVATNVTERIRLERQILEISEREQARIGQDIHDDLCQQLVGIAFDINSLERTLASVTLPQAAHARRIAGFVDAALTQSRQLARGLFPVKLDAEGLASALQELAASTTARQALACSFEPCGPVPVTHSLMAIQLFRIAQEAVNNALRHAHARHLHLRLARTARQLELTITDDGCGLPAGTGRATGMGRHIMEYRARSLQGTLRFRPNPGGGTVVSCCVPLPPE